MKQLMWIVAVMALLTGCRHDEVEIVSPDGALSVKIADGRLTASVDTATINGQLAIAIDGLDSVLSVEGPTLRSIDYNMVAGKRRHCTNQANGYVVTYADAQGAEHTLELLVANDGLAYRFTGLTGDAPRVSYVLPEGQKRYQQRYTDVYEDFYRADHSAVQSEWGKAITRWGYPLLTSIGDNAWALVTEAGIEKGMRASWLETTADSATVAPGTDVLYTITLGEAAEGGVMPDRTPWRVVVMGSLADIVESTLVTDVSPESTITDTSWIEPGSVSWVYWVYNHGSKEYPIVKQYIDMAATLGWPYVLIDAEWDEMSGGGNIDDALAYAAEKGVKVLIWYNSSTAWVNNGAPGPYYRLNDPEQREKELQWLNDKGVAGVKIDFFDGDKQAATDYSIDLIESCAKHHLLVNLHGATLPRGWQRTYPNLLTTEAVYGAEWYNNLPVLTDRAAAHNATLPFTRNVVGPMDYTPCTFSDSQHPHITTHAHELALPVIFESGLLHWADKPESYLAQPAEVQHLLSTLPTVWDETLLLGGYPGKYVVMARRNGDDWYVGAINGLDEAQTIDIDLSRLSGKPDQWLIYADGTDDDPWAISQGPVTRQLTLKPRGGLVLAPVK